MLGYIPSPSVNGFNVGPLRLHAYGFLIVLGVFAAVWLADRRWRARGGDAGTFSNIAVWAVPAGLIGARISSLLTDYELYEHNLLNAFKIWQGGLGIWGGIAGGALGAWLYIRRNNIDFLATADAVAPALPLAQAIGRWGNYFNQELFGRPTNLPWGLKIDPTVVQNLFSASQRTVPQAYLQAKAFQPTFLYESLWDLAVVFLVLAIEKRVRLKKGYLFWVYVSLYTFGRFFTEYLRIDFAHKILGLRFNDWVSIIVFAIATILLLTRGLVREKETKVDDDEPDLERSPVAVAARAASGLTLEEESIGGQSMTSEVTGYGLHVEAVEDREPHGPTRTSATNAPAHERPRPAAEPVTSRADPHESLAATLADPAAPIANPTVAEPNAPTTEPANTQAAATLADPAAPVADPAEPAAHPVAAADSRTDPAAADHPAEPAAEPADPITRSALLPEPPAEALADSGEAPDAAVADPTEADGHAPAVEQRTPAEPAARDDADPETGLGPSDSVETAAGPQVITADTAESEEVPPTP
jgi:prolipoprotein diacylglyceryl transferase